MNAKIFELQYLGIGGKHYVDAHRLHSLKAEISGFLLKEETYWEKRAQVLWLEEGDKNIYSLYLCLCTSVQE